MIILILIVILGSISLCLTMVKSGLLYTYGYGFWGANGHDGIWHIALIESLARRSWQMPIFPPEKLANYHIGFDLIVAIVHKITQIPVSTLYFQIIPIFFAFSIGICVYLFVREWRKSETAALFSVFFIYFGGSFGWIISILRSGNFDGESVFWSQQSVSTLINPPFAMSIVAIFAGLYLLIKGLRLNQRRELIIATFLFGMLIQIKVYAGILVLVGLFAASVWRLFFDRKTDLVKVFTGSLVLSILLFSPLNKDSGTQIFFQPFWFLENMMALSDRVGWEKFYSAMFNYKAGHVYPKLILTYSVSLVIFIIGNLGTRVLSFLYLIRRLLKPKQTDYVDVFVAAVVSAGITIPMLFVQSGSPWNTIQFFYYSLTFTGILAAVVLADILKYFSIPIKALIVLSTIILTLPTTLAALSHHYLPPIPPAKISKEELEALNFLSSQTQGIVLTYPFDKDKAKEAQNNPPRPLYLYDSTAYVSAYSKHDVYLEDEVNLNITGFDWKKRRDETIKFYESLDANYVRKFLASNNISYVYWIKGQRALLGETQLGLDLIFENSQVTVFKVQRN